MIKNNRGFSIIELLLIVGVLAGVVAVGFFAYSNFKENQDDQSSDTSAVVSKGSELVLQNLGLENFDSMIVDTNAVPDYRSNGLKGFYVFGDVLEGNRLNPTFEYASMKADTKVISALDGVVVFIKEQPDTKDAEVFIQPAEGSPWQVGYDHITNLAVKKGDFVKAGDIIGNPAIQNNGAYRFEIQVNKDEKGTTTHYCPVPLLAEGARSVWSENLTAIQSRWEGVTGFDLYDLTKQDPVGCLKKTLTVAEAEGR